MFAPAPTRTTILKTVSAAAQTRPVVGQAVAGAVGVPALDPRWAAFNSQWSYVPVEGGFPFPGQEGGVFGTPAPERDAPLDVPYRERRGRDEPGGALLFLLLGLASMVWWP